VATVTSNPDRTHVLVDFGAADSRGPGNTSSSCDV